MRPPHQRPAAYEAAGQHHRNTHLREPPMPLADETGTTVALADLATNDETGIPWRTCQVCHALATIPAAEADALRTLLRGDKRYTWISDKIAADPDTPLQLHPDSLSRHARGRCEAKEKLR